jgi:hypothetical protein
LQTVAAFDSLLLFFCIILIALQPAISLLCFLFQIALQGVGGVDKQHLQFLIRQERLVRILSRDVFLKPVVQQQRRISCEIIMTMLEYCSHESGTIFCISLSRIL